VRAVSRNLTGSSSAAPGTAKGDEAVVHIEDRWERVADGRRVRTDRHGSGRRWRARYLDPDGRQRSRTFARKVEAERFLATVETDKLRGAYIDPDAGRVTLREYGDEWLAGRTFDESTREVVRSRLRVHVYPHMGDRELAAIRPSHVQAWLRGLQQSLAPRYVRVIFANLSAILAAAVDDERIVKNPCRASSVRPPRSDPARVEPWLGKQVEAVHDTLPERYRVMVTLAAGLGLRQGEVFGLAVEDVDFLRGVVHVRRQVKIVASSLVFAPPKGGKTRDVPIPQAVALELSAHIVAHPPHEVTLQWQTTDGAPTTAALLLVTRERKALNRNYVNTYLWGPAVTKAGLERVRSNGMHALRHWYASVLLEAGVSIKALSEYLGHADPGFTLRTYTHLMPSSEAKAREAVDKALAQISRGPQTAQSGL
jgi:integrase